MTAEKIALQTQNGKVYCEVDYDKEDGVLNIKWNGYQTIEDITKGYNEVASIANNEGYSTKRLLIDTSDMKGPMRYDRHWISKEYYDIFKGIGVEKIGGVMTARIFSVDQAENEKEYAEKNIKTKFFHNPGFARAWLVNR